MHKGIINNTAFFFCLLCLIIGSCETKTEPVNTSPSTSSLVDLQTHKLQFKIKKGDGIPIVFEAGGGNDHTIWDDFVNSLHQQLGTTIITYDRAGYGNSENNPELEEEDKGYILNTVLDLEAALKALGFKEEVIMVAHSYGGFSAALFAQRNPEWVKGVVLLDANLKCFFDEETREKFKAMGTEAMLENLKKQNIGLYYEALAIDSSVVLIQQTTFPAQLPIFSIMAETPNQFNDPAEVEKWLTCQKNFGKDDPKKAVFVARNSGHYVFYDNPTFVQEKIIQLYEQITAQREQMKIKDD